MAADCVQGSSFPGRTSNDSHGQIRSEQCATFGLELKDGPVRGVRLMDMHAAAEVVSTSRLAVCVTGQPRGFPVSYLNWRDTVMRLLRVGGLALDFFFVLSNSSSFSYWSPFVESLQPVRLVVTEPTAVFNRTATAADGWAARQLGGDVHFNLAAFPWFTEHKYGVELMQQWHLSLCHDIIQQHEQSMRASYRRVARLRADTVFSGLGDKTPTIPKAPGVPQPGMLPHTETVASYLDCGSHSSARHQCSRLLAEGRAKMLASCGSYLSQIELRGVQWVMANGFFMAGSRDVVLDYFRGLVHLQRARRRGTASRLVHLVDVWAVITREVRASFPRMTHGGPCAIATRDTDLVRSAGPPVGRFFLQWAEGAEEIAPCLRWPKPEECVQALVEDKWLIPLAATRTCLGLEYDGSKWNTSCTPAQIADDLARAHAHNFGPRLLGDLRKWAHGRMPSGGPNGMWIHSARTQTTDDGYQST